MSRKISEKTREKMRERMMGNKINLGRKLSIEERNKRSISMKGKMPKFIPNNKGIKRTEENKKKISETLKKLKIKPPSRRGCFKKNALTKQIENIQPLCKSCNCRKQTKIIIYNH